jgi:hypothetical protein
VPVPWVNDFDLPKNSRSKIQDEETTRTHLSFNLKRINAWVINDSECMSNDAYFCRSRELCQHIQADVQETSMQEDGGDEPADGGY